MTDSDELAAIRERDISPSNQLALMHEPPPWDCVLTMQHDRRLCLAEIDRLHAMLGRDDGKQLVIERLERERDALAAELAAAKTKIARYDELFRWSNENCRDCAEGRVPRHAQPLPNPSASETPGERS